MSINSHTLALLLFLLLSGCSVKQLGPEVLDGAVRFDFFAPKAFRVAIAGSFNRWDPGMNPLSGPDRKGVWTITLPLPEGRYEYLFVVDGSKWQADPGALSVDDGLGGKNSIVEVRR